MLYLVYKITNKIDGKIYVGVHKTLDLNDEYFGSGIMIKRSIEKYGIDNFEKEIIACFDNPESMYKMESEIVNEEFVNRKDTYNMKLGGFGSFDYINSNGFHKYPRKGNPNVLKSLEKANEVFLSMLKDPEFKGEWIDKVKKGLEEYYLTNHGHWLGKNHKQETIDKQKKTFLEIEHQKGNKNSQFGTVWIHNVELKQNKKILKTDSVPEGWIKGRKIKF